MYTQYKKTKKISIDFFSKTLINEENILEFENYKKSMLFSSIIEDISTYHI
jgi:hypothetical protein